MAKLTRPRSDGLIETYQALVHLQSGQLNLARTSLARAIELRRLTHYPWGPGWNRPGIARLAAFALSEGRHIPEMQRIVEGLRMTPPSPDIEHWPWAVRIRVLDGFSIQVAGQAAKSSVGKASHRILALLKALAALGGDSVPADLLADLIWPEADGDNARRSLDTSLSRLRKMLHCDQALTIHDGKLSLNPIMTGCCQSAANCASSGLKLPKISRKPIKRRVPRQKLNACAPESNESQPPETGCIGGPMNRIDPLDLILLLAGKSAVLTISALLAVFAAPSVAQYKALEGTPEKLGTVDFRISCNSDAQRHFTRGVSLYHSYYWPEARKAFSAAAQADPSCAMPHWGHSIVLMGNAFAWPLSGKALKEGLDAVERAKSLEPKTARERDFVASAESFFKDADKIPPRTRQLAYELSLENRFRALSGAARAAELAGDSTRAREYYSQTQKLWADADHESPELSRIKAYLVKN